MAEHQRGFIRSLILRTYTFAVMAVVVWSGYMAVHYLYRTVFKPGEVPAQLLAWQGASQAEALRAPEALGITEPALRSPIGHYHGVDRWFQPDTRNGCITSGCHDPVPHSKSKDLRAFANLHSTFLDCDVCHREHENRPTPAAWVSLAAGRVQPPPAILQLLSQSAVATQPADLADRSAALVALLRQAIDVIGGDPLLSYLAIQLETSEPGSPVWRKAMAQLQSELPNHARGEYGAKITPVSAKGEPVVHNNADLIEQYFSRESAQADRGAIHKKLHEGVIVKPEGCLPCHRAEPAMLDFDALGYSTGRISELTSTPIVGMMQQIREGQPFSLPLGP